MKKFWLLLFMLSVTKFAQAVDEPKYQVLVSDGLFEVRQYESIIIAQVEVDGNMSQAGSLGFRPLADYIFGNNSGNTSIKMTAPVSRSKKDDETWIVSFVMPAQWDIDSLPKPNNPSVTIIEKPAETMATLRFSGRASGEKFVAKQEELQNWLQAQSFASSGEALYAGYNAPYVPGPFRRNEVMIPVRRQE